LRGRDPVPSAAERPLILLTGATGYRKAGEIAETRWSDEAPAPSPGHGGARHGSRLVDTRRSRRQGPLGHPANGRLRPAGVPGLAYWDTLWTLHSFDFDGMLQRIAATAVGSGG
jgi:hypothetical protein